MIQNKKQKKYEVFADLSSIPLGCAKNSFQVKIGNSVLGTLMFSRGSIQWYAKNGKKPCCDLSWEQFANLMESQKGA